MVDFECTRLRILITCWEGSFFRISVEFIREMGIADFVNIVLVLVLENYLVIYIRRYEDMKY